MKPILIILAAGLGNRYGSLKQLETVGPQGEAIIDYSVFDALRSGFGKVVLVIRRELEEAFTDRIKRRFEKQIDVSFVYQEQNKLPDGFQSPANRSKPWGTAHALLAAEPEVDAPFAVINADDFYGQSAYGEMSRFLTESRSEHEHAMVGYKLGNTLSEHGTVSRGICQMDENGYLQTVKEIKKIRWNNEKIIVEDSKVDQTLRPEDVVSMNFWGFKPSVFPHIKEGFRAFLHEHIDDTDSEYYIPAIVDDLIRQGQIRVNVIKCDSDWFGITYKQDLAVVRQSIQEKIASGEYPGTLWD